MTENKIDALKDLAFVLFIFLLDKKFAQLISLNINEKRNKASVFLVGISLSIIFLTPPLMLPFSTMETIMDENKDMMESADIENILNFSGSISEIL